MTRKRRGLNNFVLFCTSLFLFLSIVETVYRNILKPREDYFANDDNRLVFRTDSVLGGQLAQTGKFSSTRLTSSGDTVYHASYTIIADSGAGSFSYNHRVGYLEPGLPDPGIVLLGCSFTFGQGVNDSETLAWRLGALRSVSTLNLGGVGYGIHHVYEIFTDKYANKNNKNRLFIYTLIPDHIPRAAGVYMHSAGPSFRIAGDSLIYNGPLPIPKNRIAEYASLFGCYSFIKNMVANIEEKGRCRRIPAEEYRKAYLMIRNMKQSAMAGGGSFLLLFWDAYNSKDANIDHRPDLENMVEKLRKDSVRVLRVSDILDVNNPDLYFPNDGHPRAMAYDTIAKYLARHPELPR